jgi:hypothetical protein
MEGDPIEDQKRRMALMMTLDQCIALDARIGDLKREVQAVKAREGFCANEIWYCLFKPRVVQLVGWRRLEPGETPYPRKERGTYSIGELAERYFEEMADRQRRIESGELHPIEELISTEAYDAVYQGLYDLLPDCNHEGGICG